MSLYTFYSLCLLCIWILHLQMLKLHLHIQQDSDWFTLALTFNTTHIYYHMDAAQSVWFKQMYLTYLDYLVVQCWVCITYLSYDMLNQRGTHIYKCVKFFSGMVQYLPLGDPWDCILVIIHHPNAAIPLFVTAFLVLWNALTNHCHFAADCQVLIQHPWANYLHLMSLQVIMWCQWICMYLSILFAHFMCLCIEFMSSWCSWVLLS